MAALVLHGPAVASPPGEGGDVIDFGKFELDTTDSHFVLYDDERAVSQRRAGSGNGNLDECTPNQGPLPDGQYDGVATWHQDKFAGTKIYGRVVRLQNKACWDGQIRSDLFIHTEETPEQGQAPAGGRRDHDQRWDGNGDYKSQGCIKLSRAENGGDNGISTLDSWWHEQAGGGVGTPYHGLLNVWWL
ncbi:MAG: hypothetical protein ACRD0C_11305 [Acidimicrobiia bacterium]